MPIKDDDYNQAKAILVQAGSKSASKSHDKHTNKKGSPDKHGEDLLKEAQDEWGANITPAQTQALAKARKKMGL